MTKIKKKNKSIVLLSVFVLSCLSPILVLGDPVPTVDYSWQETTLHFSLDRVWDGDSNIINFTGTYSDVINTMHSYYNGTDNTKVREARTTYYDANYSVYNNKTIEGYIDIVMDLDVYRVDVQYGKSVELIWMALKEGSFNVEYYREQWEEDFSFVEENYQEIESDFTKINLSTMEVISTWSESYNKTESLNMTIDREPFETHDHYLSDVEFSMPIVLVMQMYTTQNKDKIAWAEMFYDYIIYKDKDGDGIYSAGETDNPSHSGFSLRTSDEHVGVIAPQAVNWHTYKETTSIITNITTNKTSHRLFPHDKTVSEIASTIQFSPPSLTDTNIVSWDINYPQFPLMGAVIDHDKSMDEWYIPDVNATYALSSPGDFSYQFDYNLSESQADLDFTLNMSKISKEDLYNATQGYGLSLPHYNYFLASFDVNEVDPTELTVLSDIFTFESNGTTVAEINLLNPAKKNYTLFDYPELGMDSQMESYGGSVHKLLVSNSEQSANPQSPFLNLLYVIEEVVAVDPTFTVVDDLYKIETQNYPVWNGEKLSHDPTFTIYYEDQSQEGEETPPSGPDTAIPGFDLLFVVTLVSAVAVLQMLRAKKRIRDDKI